MGRYAVIETGSKQYRVEPQGFLEIERLSISEGQKEIILDKVLWVQDGEQSLIGKPYVAGAKVACSVVSMGDDDCGVKGVKVRAYKKKRRKGFDKTIGHRQRYTEISIDDIVA